MLPVYIEDIKTNALILLAHDNRYVASIKPEIMQNKDLVKRLEHLMEEDMIVFLNQSQHYLTFDYEEKDFMPVEKVSVYG